MPKSFLVTVFNFTFDCMKRISMSFVHVVWLQWGKREGKVKDWRIGKKNLVSNFLCKKIGQIKFKSLKNLTRAKPNLERK